MVVKEPLYILLKSSYSSNINILQSQVAHRRYDLAVATHWAGKEEENRSYYYAHVTYYADNLFNSIHIIITACCECWRWILVLFGFMNATICHTTILFSVIFIIPIILWQCRVKRYKAHCPFSSLWIWHYLFVIYCSELWSEIVY